MTKYLITYICGDTYNIPTFDILECDEKQLISILDKYSDYFGWRKDKAIQIYELSRKIDKWDLENDSCE